MKVPVPSGESDLLQCIIDAVSDPVFVKDRDHRWVLFNEAFVSLLGCPREQIAGKSDHDFFPKTQADIFRRQNEFVFETGQANSNEELLSDSQGKTSVLLTRKALWTSPEGNKYLIGVIRDMTAIVGAADEAKRSMDRLHRAQKLETMGHLAAAMAHDFNNLLAAIRGCAGLLMESLPSTHPHRVEVEEIGHAVERASALTAQLLACGRRPGGMPRSVQPAAIIEGMLEMLRRLLPSDVQLEVILSGNPSAIRVDPGLVEQVLLNLVVNAGEALPAGGRVTISLSTVGVGGSTGRPRVRLSVRDDGVGMTEAVRRRIFEPFYTTKEDGSGLGLSTVAETVRRSDGEIKSESAPGKGSAFHVYWPLSEETASLSHKPSRRVLVVDDDEAVRRFAARCLEREGYEVASAGNTAEALRLSDANEGLFTHILIDVVMPGMRGSELAERLCVRQPRARVLFMSGQNYEETPLTVDTKSRFLSKPFSASDLIKCFNVVPRGEDGPSPRVRRQRPARSRRKAS